MVTPVTATPAPLTFVGAGDEVCVRSVTILQKKFVARLPFSYFFFFFVLTVKCVSSTPIIASGFTSCVDGKDRILGNRNKPLLRPRLIKVMAACRKGRFNSHLLCV